MPVDPNMGFDNPTPSVTVGPTYAQQISAALTTIGAHQHTGDPIDGRQIPMAGLLMDDDLPFGGNGGVSEATYVSFREAAAAAAVDGSLSVVQSTGDLYYRTLSGTLIRITAGTVLDTSAENTVWDYLAVSGDHTILNTDTDVFVAVNTSAAHAITLPTAGSVGAGRRYVIADVSGDADVNPITLTPSGGDTFDGDAARVIQSTYGRLTIVSDGTSNWHCADSWNARHMAVRTADSVSIVSTGGDVDMVASTGGASYGSALATLDLTALGAVTLSGAAALVLGGGTTAALSATTALSLTGGTTAALTATAGALTMTGGTTATLAASGGAVTLSGSTSASLTGTAGALTLTGGTTASLTASAGALDLTASADITLTATGDDIILASATVQATTTGAQTYDALGAITIEADGIVRVESTADDLSIAANSEDQSIALTSTGIAILASGGAISLASSTFGAFNVTPVSRPTVSGSVGGNAALISLLTALEDLGLIVDGSS